MTHVLLVDDNPAIVDALAMELRYAGHDVSTAANGPDAIELVTGSRPPDVAVLDIGMPGMSGFTLARALRQLPGCADLPVVFLTASGQVDDMIDGLSLGAIYLTKPCPASSLLAAVERPRPAPPF